MPKIIDDDLWNEVKKKMDNNKAHRGAAQAKKIYLLSGLIYCGKCGHAMTGNSRHSGKIKLYMKLMNALIERELNNVI
ncbi:zinc ribbon domain-containing protein [Clostridium butyricum]